MQRNDLAVILLAVLNIGWISACNVPLEHFHRERIQQAYIKASNTGSGDFFGSVALSADGTTLVVGAPGEDSGATGIDGGQDDASADSSGAVYVFTLTGTTWSQQAYIKASNAGPRDRFGSSVALSSDGLTLAVAAPGEASAAIGIDGDQANNLATGSGAVYVFALSGVTWSQQAYVKASNTGPDDNFGFSVALSADGSTLAVGAPGEDSAAIGVGGTQTSNTAVDAGAVYVFTHKDANWSQQAYVKASNTSAADGFGSSVTLSNDGSILAIGTPGEDSAATGVGGTQTSNAAIDAGAVYVFARSATTWSQQAYVKASNTSAADGFGYSVALSSDGSALAVGAPGEDSAAIGINGSQSDNLAMNAGAVYVFTLSSMTWSQQAYVKASNTGADDRFGQSIALSADGTTLAVGASNEDSAATGIDGEQNDETAINAGAVYVFTRLDTMWSQQAYVKASNTESYDAFSSVALSADSLTLAIGATLEDGASRGIDGNQADNTSMSAGSVYVFR